MKNIIILLLLIVSVCGKTSHITPCTDEIKISEIIKTAETLGFSFDTSRVMRHLKVKSFSFPNDSCLLNVYRLRKSNFYCELEMYLFQFDTIPAGDSININHVFVEYLGAPFNSDNKLLTYLHGLPPHFGVSTNVIKNISSLFIYKITFPGYDSIYSRELGNSIYNAMQDDSCEKIGSYFHKVINE